MQVEKVIKHFDNIINFVNRMIVRIAKQFFKFVVPNLVI